MRRRQWIATFTIGRLRDCARADRHLVRHRYRPDVPDSGDSHRRVPSASPRGRTWAIRRLDRPRGLEPEGACLDVSVRITNRPPVKVACRPAIRSTFRSSGARMRCLECNALRHRRSGRTLSRRVMASYLAFARSGNPANEELPDWPEYDMDTRRTMLFAETPEVVAAPLDAVRELCRPRRWSTSARTST